jgi:hypothetical protein
MLHWVLVDPVFLKDLQVQAILVDRMVLVIQDFPVGLDFLAAQEIQAVPVILVFLQVLVVLFVIQVVPRLL